MKIEFTGLDDVRKELEERRTEYEETLMTNPDGNDEWYTTEIANITILLMHLEELTEQMEIPTLEQYCGILKILGDNGIEYTICNGGTLIELM